MPRQARLDVPGALHHIMVRGINRASIFEDEQDKARFLDRLGLRVGDGECAVYAWVLMSNHVHILFKSGRVGLTAVMRKVLSWYAQYFNRRHNRTGHLFSNRYRSILCDEDCYLLALVRYIHLNPFRAGIVRTGEQLDQYRWSGHGALLGKVNYDWMDTESVLAQFAGSRRKAVAQYRRFMYEGMKLAHDANLGGGGLARSMGGWSQVLATRRKGQIEESDERILGSGDFVHSVLREAEERQLRQLKFVRSGHTIDAIIGEECSKYGIAVPELKHGSRRSAVSLARAVIACRGSDELGLSAAEIARHLGVATSSITRAMERRRAGWHGTQRK